MALSIRTRLTIWNGAVTALLVVVLGFIVYLALGAALLERIDAVLAFEYKETVERLETLGADDDLGGVPEAFLEEFLLRIIDTAGAVRMQSPSLGDRSWEPPSDSTSPIEPALATVEIGGHGEQRMIYGRVGGTHAGWTVQIASSLADYRRQMGELRTILYAVLPLSLLVALAAGYWLAGRALAPVERITASARRISGANLGERVTTERNDDELGRLAATLNAMVDRLANSLESTRRFTADASHEFMTPLAQIRIEAEIALQTERPAGEYADVLRSVVEEVDRLTRLASQLLALAREDGQPVAAQHEPVEVKRLIRTALDAVRPAAKEAQIELTVDETESATVEIDADRIRQVLDNLLQNAVRYNRPGGAVRVSARKTRNQITIVVADTGMGIPAESLSRIFDRFYRVESSRSRRCGGSGLGLSIAHTLVEKMGGRIEVESTLGQGSTFRIVLPVRLPPVVARRGLFPQRS